MRFARSASLLGAALGLLLCASTAGADTVAVVRLSFGDTAPALKQQVLTELAQGLKAQGHRVLLPAQVDERLGEGALAPGCSMGPCLSQIRSLIDADQLLVGSVTGQGASYDINLTLLEPFAGTVLAQVDEHCDVCTFGEASAAVGRGARLLAELAARQLRSRSWLQVRSQPPGADVRLDGVPLGKTPIRRLVVPGEHVLEVEQRQLRALARRTLRLTAGETQEVDVALEAGQQPIPALEIGAEPASAQRWLAWLTFGAGVSMSILGTVLLALHDECQGGPQCGESRETRLPGLIFAGAGLATTVVSGVLFWRELGRAPQRSATAVGVALGPNTVGLTYASHY